MPRIIVACGACNRKHATSTFEKPFTCVSCRVPEIEQREALVPLTRKLELTPLVLKRARDADEFDGGSPTRTIDACIADAQGTASFASESNEDDQGSEASDDWKCTQVCDDGSLSSSDSGDRQMPKSRNSQEEVHDDVIDIGSDDDFDDQPLIKLAGNPTHVTASALSAAILPPKCDDVEETFETDSVLSTLDDANFKDAAVCLVCGSSLHSIQNLKGRLNHMKRCSRKNGVAAKDIRWNDDHEMFVNAPIDPSPSKRTPIRNPYAKHSLPGLAAKTTTDSASAPSVITVLMAGARQVAKRKKIEAETTAAAAKLKRSSRRPWWQMRDEQPKRACPRYKMIPSTDFCVDGFNFVASTRNFFLSHFHSDHYGGITSNWALGTIYCSLVTANLVSQQLGVDRKFLHPIPLLTPVVIESQGKSVTVTAIDANHCPGAVMFLFQVGTKCVLHVGDFRWNRLTFQESPPLQPFFSGQATMDCIYLDTTYCEEKYALPTQDEAIREAIVVASRELEQSRRSKQRLLMLFGAYTIGKERIYMYVPSCSSQSHLTVHRLFPYAPSRVRLSGRAVAEHLNVKVYVDPRRYRILQQLGWADNQMNRLTTKPDDTLLWVVPLGHINMKQLPTYLQVQKGSYLKTFDRVVGFRPTGWSHSSTKKAGSSSSIISTTTRGKISVHGVPYSEHSSFPELVDCLRCLKPKRIVPTVSVSKSQQQVDLLLRNLSKP